MKKYLVIFFLLSLLVFAISGNSEGINSTSIKPSFKKGISAPNSIKMPGTYFAGISTPYRDSLYIIVDNTDGNGALTNYDNLLYLNSRSFRKAGNSATEFSKVVYATGTSNPAFYCVNKSNYAYVPHFVQTWDTTNGSKFWFKLSNTSGARDTLVLFYNNIAAPDCSHLETTFPAGDDFNNSTYSNLVQINDSATGLYQLSSFSSLRLAYSDTTNQHNAKHSIGRVGNLIYYPTDATEPYKVFTAGNATGQGFTTDSSQIWMWTATSRNQIPYTAYATAVISDKTGAANTHGGCSDPYVILVKGASSATDSLYCFFFYDSTGATNDGIYVAASQASDGATWTEKTKILSNATHKLANPVVRYEGGTWYLLYSYGIDVIGVPVNYEESIGLATSASVRSTFSVTSNTFIIPARSVTGALAADSNAIEPISIAKIGSTYYLSYACIFNNNTFSSNRAGGFFTGTGGTNISDATWARTAPVYETNNIISRATFTFLDSVDTSTGLGGFLWQYSGSDSGAYRFDFITREYNPLHATNYYLFNRGIHIPQNFNGYDSVRTVERITDSSGVRIVSATTSSGHPISFVHSGGIMAYNYPVTNDFEVIWEQKIVDWRCNSGRLINFTFSVGDTLPCADSISTNSKYVNGDRLTYTVSAPDTSAAGAMWNRTFLTGANYFNINDSAATTGTFIVGRSGFVTTADTTEAGLQYRKAMSLSPITFVDNYTTFKYRYPSISNTKWSDSTLTVFANDNAIAQIYDAYDATQRNRSKKFLGWAFGELSNGQGGIGYMKYWFIRAIQTNYREPQCWTVKPRATYSDTTSYTVGQGTYDSSYVKDACIVGWGASNAERTYNTGGSAAANNSIGYVNSTLIEESRLLIRFSTAMIPYNFQLDSAVIRIMITQLNSPSNHGGTDADGIILMAFECLKDWVEGNKTTYAAGSMDRTMCSWTRRGSGTGVGGTTIASTDSNWFSLSAGYATTDREMFSHIWGLSSSDSVKIVGAGRDSTFITLNVTPIVLKQLQTGVNYGFVIRDVSTKTASGNYYKRPETREASSEVRRPIITYYGKLVS